MRRSLLAAPLALAIALLVPAEAAHSAGTITASTDAVALGKAMMADTEWVTDAAFETKAPGNSAGLVSGEINGLPTSGENALVLSTGDVGLMTSPNTSGSSGTSLGGNNVRGNTDFDVTVLRIDLDVPDTTNCLVGMDFKFYSEEYPGIRQLQLQRRVHRRTRRIDLDHERLHHRGPRQLRVRPGRKPDQHQCCG